MEQKTIILALTNAWLLVEELNVRHNAAMMNQTTRPQEMMDPQPQEVTPVVCDEIFLSSLKVETLRYFNLKTELF